MDTKQKWELICRYVSIRKEASLQNVKFYRSKEMFKNSSSFNSLLNKMEERLNGVDENISLFEHDNIKINICKIPFPNEIDKIIFFDEYKDYPFLNDMDIWKTPFLFIRGTKANISNLLNIQKENIISVVGSRNTPEMYHDWIEKVMPIRKVVVSGLANGADLIGHRVAIQKHMKIVIFPGYDISMDPVINKMDVWGYALNEGMIISSVIPGVKTFVPADLINRNYEMAKVVSATYVLYFDSKSGTMNHLKVIAKDNKKIFVPLEIYKQNINLLQNIDIKNSLEVK